MLYLIQDATFVSSAQKAVTPLSKPQELVQLRWKRISKADIVKMVQARRGKLPCARKYDDTEGPTREAKTSNRIDT
jgi:hypothetical protein